MRRVSNHHRTSAADVGWKDRDTSRVRWWIPAAAVWNPNAAQVAPRRRTARWAADPRVLAALVAAVPAMWRDRGPSAAAASGGVRLLPPAPGFARARPAAPPRGRAGLLETGAARSAALPTPPTGPEGVLVPLAASWEDQEPGAARGEQRRAGRLSLDQSRCNRSSEEALYPTEAGRSGPVRPALAVAACQAVLRIRVLLQPHPIPAMQAIRRQPWRCIRVCAPRSDPTSPGHR